MPVYPFLQVDAFTRRPLAGNACAVLFDADDLDDAAMLAIAREMNLSETSFVVRSVRADLGARYFTPSGEIPLAGHPTVATLFALAEAGRLALSGDRTCLTLELTAGIVDIEVLARDGRAERVTMTQIKPRFLATVPVRQVLTAIGLQAGDLLEGAAPQVVSTGTPQLMVALAARAALDRARPDLTALGRLKRDHGFSSAHLFCLTGTAAGVETLARNFDTPPDILEDPFTGSATGGMAAYLWHHDLIDTPHLRARQGDHVDRPGEGQAEVIGPRDDIETVRVGGPAVIVVTGELRL